MAIPKPKELFMPILNLLNDGEIHELDDTIENLCQIFKLTPEECELKNNSGKRIIRLNTTRAITTLRANGLLCIVKIGYHSITEKGKLELSNNCEKNNIIDTIKDVASPQELIEINFEIIQLQLQNELLELILQNSPTYFEKLVIDLLVNMGYGGSRKEAGHAVGKSGDEGIDGVINEDRLGLDNIYIQAKHWAKNNTVGRPEIQKFIGALAGKQASKGIFITTSSFSSEARSYVKNLQQKVILIDGIELTSYMLEYDVGVSTYNKYVIKKIDYDYFDEV